MNIVLTAEQIRALGCLLEKEITTPEYYPPSLNSVTNACNQKSCRDPLVQYEEQLVRETLEQLRDLSHVGFVSTADSRVPKYRQRLTELYFFTPQERAVMTELLLRGAQTPGELRSRAERMHKFVDLQEIQNTLEELMKRPDGPWVTPLPREPGRKEIRYMHLLSGAVVAQTSDAASPAPQPTTPLSERLAQCEQEIAVLKKELNDLRQDWTTFKKQFERYSTRVD